ncbi:MAG: 50S ribosomal protein L16 [Methanomicrobiales archaeon HGW-Methanomicrobiales-3]|jgi:large subunit ribosomal protein L10e|nr:MAG: 50S ribosomal protein L16 [Methanomicrobiales archaeon HGW-Methanomicrobiales-3]
MVRKPAKMYRNVNKKAYTRRKYMGGVPGSKIVQFEMGNLSQEFPTEIDLIVDETCQIRHSSLEAARITANRRLMKDVGRSNFHFKIRVFPHHVLRENKQATGAGADRVSEGMRLAFGKAVGTAARVESGQKIMTVFSTEQYLEKIKDALRHSGHKLPTPSHLKVSTIKVSGRIIAAPKLVGEKVVAAPVVAEEAAAEPAKDAKGAAPAAKGGKDAKADDKKGAAPAKGGKK